MIAVLQPHIPHYREEFFEGIHEKYSCDLFCYQDLNTTRANNFNDASSKTIQIKSFEKFGFLLYNPFVFKDYDTLILMLNFGHITTWFLLLTKFIHQKKIIIWGQGISVKRYVKEEKEPSLLLKYMISMSDCVWFYTQKELKIWQVIFPKKKMVSLSNTISNVSEIVSLEHSLSKIELKKKYKIKQERCFIFCARFNNPHRRVDLLLEAMKRLDRNKYGFIIIGEGPFKPNFLNQSNVYDFKSVYDKQVKDDLFTIADFYYQPGWVGLSVVEALAYGKPIFTFVRTEETLQCVEYSYIVDGYNGLIFLNMDDFIEKINSISAKDIFKMGLNAQEYVRDNLLMSNMVSNATATFSYLRK